MTLNFLKICQFLIVNCTKITFTDIQIVQKGENSPFFSGLLTRKIFNDIINLRASWNIGIVMPF